MDWNSLGQALEPPATRPMSASSYLHTHGRTSCNTSPSNNNRVRNHFFLGQQYLSWPTPTLVPAHLHLRRYISAVFPFSTPADAKQTLKWCTAGPPALLARSDNLTRTKRSPPHRLSDRSSTSISDPFSLSQAHSPSLPSSCLPTIGYRAKVYSLSFLRFNRRAVPLPCRTSLLRQVFCAS